MNHAFSFQRTVIAITMLVFLMGHGGGCCAGDEAVLGPPTGATCPPTSNLRYATFGQPFMESYCTRCHSSTLTGAARQGAPAFHDMDTQAGIQQIADHIDETAGSGPEASNDQMPPSGPRPTRGEREQLAEWLACGAP